MGVDLTKIPTEDLEAMQGGDLTKVSTPTLEYLQGQGATSSPVPEKTVSGAIGNLVKGGEKFVKNTADMLVHSPVDVALGLGKVAIGGGTALARKAGLIDADTPQSPGEVQARNLAAPFVQAYRNPSGIPQQLADAAYADPFAMGMNVSTGLGVLGKGAEVAGLARTASGLGKASELTNPLTTASKGITAPLNAIADTGLPESLYGRTMKIPPGSLDAEGRMNVLKTLVRDEQLPLGKKTISVMQTRIKGLDDGITSAIKDATQQGGKMDVNKISTALDDLKTQYANRPNPEPYYAAIDAAKDDFINHAFVNNGELTLSDAHSLKKGTYQEIQNYYMKQQKPETGQIGVRNDIDSVAKAKAASVIKQEVLDNPLVPDSVKTDMKSEAGLMNARKWVERATNRGGNLDPISLSGMLFGVMVEKGMPAAAAWRVAMSQPVMSRFAIGLAKPRTPIPAEVGNAAFQVQQAVGNNQ